MNEQFKIHQYFGPNIRCGFPAIEISFPERQPMINWADVSMLLQSIGVDVVSHEGNGQLEFAEALGQLAVVLQSEPGIKWKVGYVRRNAWVCLAYRNAMVTQNALILAFHVLRNFKSDNSELLGALKQQLRYASGTLPGLMMQMLEAEAEERGIPVYDVSLRIQTRQFGQGAFGWHFVFAAQQSDSFTGYRLARDKIATCELLARLGYPYSVHIPVLNSKQAEHAAKKLGFPCVIKPIDRGMGLGITVGIETMEEVSRAFVAAKKYTKGPVLVERQVEGYDHRMAVFAGKMLWVNRRSPPHVTGDGISTLGNLIDKENTRRSQVKKRLGMLDKQITIDDGLLSFVQKQDLTLTTIIPAGQYVYLRGQANTSQGGTSDDVTALVHPENLEMAEQVARAFRLGSMGLDFITPDISRSWREGQCAIIEVNATPGMAGVEEAHLVVKAQFPFLQNGRVPTFLVIGEQSDANALVLIHLLESKGFVVGRSLSQETAVGENILCGVSRKPLAFRAEALILHSDTESIVISTTEEEILEYGLPLDRFSVIIWQHVKGQVDPDMAKMLDANCSYWICRNEFPPEILTEIVARSVEDCQHNMRAIPDHIVVKDGPSLISHADSLCIETNLTVWRMPCIPLDLIKQAVSGLLETALHGDFEAYLLTQDLVPQLIATWSHALLRLTGHPVTEIAAVTPMKDKQAYLIRQREYRLSFSYGHLEAVRVAQAWSFETLNHFVNTFIRCHSLASCAMDLKAVTGKTLMELKRFAP